MKHMTLMILTLISIFACDRGTTPAPTKTDFLTSGSQKSWYPFSSTPDDACGSISDDTWTFFANGTFTYDHGTITEDVNNNCGDLINLEGSWEFSNNETTLTVTGLREAGASTDNLSLTLMQGDVTLLDNDRLVVSTTGPNSVQYIIEFRKK